MAPSTAASVDFTLNGRPITADVSSHATLLDFLRASGLTGAKEGCAEGECGACTVVMVSPMHGAGLPSEYKAFNSCLMLLPMAAGHEIYTVEALARDGRLAEAQTAMAAAGGSQCGYCTPGFVMSLFAEHYRPGRTGPCDTAALAGNLCRCTGYRPIRDAASALGPAPDDAWRARLSGAAPALAAVDVAGFARPTTIEEALAVLAATPDATLVAGGTDVGVEANLRARRWPRLVSLEAIPELQAFIVSAERVRIGSALPLSELGRRWPDAPAVIDEWLTLFASPPIRNRATLGGNLATGSPVADSAPLLLALDARVEIAGSEPADAENVAPLPARGDRASRHSDTESGARAPAPRRLIPLSDFFLDYRTTALRPGEILTAVEIPRPLPSHLRFYKVAKRRADDISVVAAAMAIDLDGDGCVSRARIAFGGVAATPVRVRDAEAAIDGRTWDRDAVARAQAAIARTLQPMSDHRGSATYRLQVAQSLVEKFWWETQA